MQVGYKCKTVVKKIPGVEPISLYRINGENLTDKTGV